MIDLHCVSWLRVSQGLLDFSKKCHRRQNRETGKPLAEISANWIIFHQTQQVSIATNQIVGFSRQCQINVLLVFWVAWVGKLMRNWVDQTCPVVKLCDQSLGAFIG